MTPMLCFPLTRDQPYNANRVETLKLGKTLHPVDTDAKKIFDSLIELIEDKDYQQNLKEFRKLFYNYKEKETLYNQLTQLTA